MPENVFYSTCRQRLNEGTASTRYIIFRKKQFRFPQSSFSSLRITTSSLRKTIRLRTNIHTAIPRPFITTIRTMSPTITEIISINTLVTIITSELPIPTNSLRCWIISYEGNKKTLITSFKTTKKS